MSEQGVKRRAERPGTGDMPDSAAALSSQEEFEYLLRRATEYFCSMAARESPGEPRSESQGQHSQPEKPEP